MQASAAKLRVLIIEDDILHVQMTERMIERLGYEHTLAHFESGGKAIDYLEKRLENHEPLPNLIIVDLRLPGEDGFEILKKIKSHPVLKKIPAILNSSFAETEHIRETYKLESAFFVSKDYDTSPFMEAIKALKILGRF